MTKDEALTMALEALDEWGKGFPDLVGDLDKQAIAAIKEALAQPQQEPVAISLNTGTKQGVKWLKNVEHGESLYTSPPQRKPLTDKEIMAIGKELGLKCRLGGNSNIDFDYARAIEAAHGITAATQLKE